MFLPSGVLLRSDEPPHCPQSPGPMPIGWIQSDRPSSGGRAWAASFLASVSGDGAGGLPAGIGAEAGQRPTARQPASAPADDRCQCAFMIGSRFHIKSFARRLQRG